GPTEHVLLVQAGIPGLESILRSDLETFEERVRRAARALKIDPPSDLTMTGWWEQARTLETLPETEETAAADAAGAILRLILRAVGLLGAVVGWIVAWALGRPRRRPVVGRRSGRAA